jgi:hypothetical protein
VSRTPIREVTQCRAKTKLGPDHPDTLTSMNNLAVSYGTLGRHADAVKLHEETLAPRKTKLGPEPRTHTLRSMAKLANLPNSYIAVGRTRDALPLLEEAGIDYPRDTAISRMIAALQAWFGQDEVYASRWQSPAPAQDSLPGAGPALPGGIGYPQGSDERFHI